MMAMTDKMVYIYFFSFPQNDFRRWNSKAQCDPVGGKIRWLFSSMAAEIGLQYDGYQQQITTMIKMLMIA